MKILCIIDNSTSNAFCRALNEHRLNFKNISDFISMKHPEGDVSYVYEYHVNDPSSPNYQKFLSKMESNNWSVVSPTLIQLKQKHIQRISESFDVGLRVMKFMNSLKFGEEAKVYLCANHVTYLPLLRNLFNESIWNEDFSYSLITDTQNIEPEIEEMSQSMTEIGEVMDIIDVRDVFFASSFERVKENLNTNIDDNVETL